MNNYEFLEKLGFSSNEAKVYGTLIKHKVLNGYEIAKLSGVARSLVYEVINRLVAKGAVIRIDGEPNFYKPLEYQDLIRSIKEENEKNIKHWLYHQSTVNALPADRPYFANKKLSGHDGHSAICRTNQLPSLQKQVKYSS